MTRLVRTLALAAAATLLAVPSAAGYGHLTETVGSQPLEKHWPTSAFPIHLTIDGGSSAAFQGEINTALATWNAVPTARDVWDTTPVVAADDFTKANYLSKWGNLSGDGTQEVVVDADGSILSDFGLSPASTNGFGESGGVIHNGEAEIQDMFLLINGSRANFDRQATEIHELGHTLGLAHSTAGFSLFKDGSLSPLLEAQVPTMDPFGISTNDRQTLEDDDRASLSELYPAPDGSFSSTLGTITGTVTRCTGEPVLGANVRAVSVADPSIQLTQVTGVDGATDGSYTIHGVPPGEYDVVVEPLGGDQAFMDALGYTTRIDSDFTAEYINASEDDCAQDTDPNAGDPVQVGASGIKTADFKVEGASLALVVDITASMGPDINAVKLGLDAMISGLEATGSSFPKTAIVTFDDASHLQVVSRDPDRLREVVNNLTGTTHTADCPEGSNRALMTAARQLGSGGTAILVTDADSHRTGPSREAVEAFYRAKGARLNTMLSGSCPPEQNPPARGRSFRTALTPPLVPGAGPDGNRPADTLGVENAVRTFSEESVLTGGLLSFQPEVKTGPADVQTRYSNTLANIGISAVRPALAAVNPATVPQSTALDVELTGSHTSFRSGSTVAISGTGVTASAVRVLSPTRILVHLAATGAAAGGFRDVTVRTPRGDGTVATATGLGSVEVVGPPVSPTILSVAPSSGAVGTTEDVTISGGATNFTSGSVAGFGAGVTVNHLTVSSPTSAVANITIDPGATIGFRDAGVAGAAPARFLVAPPTPAIARLTGATPSSGVRGATIDVALTGADTAFAPGTSLTEVSGSGVKVLSTTVHSPTSATARLQIAPTAPLGFRDLTIATGAESAALLDGFEIRAVQQGGNPPPTTCSDHARPTSSLLKGKQGAALKRHKLKLRGRASDAGCTATISVAGKVARVEVAISRKAGRHCRFVASSGKLGRARKCSKPVFLKARGTTAWSLSVKRRLPHGKYTILVRARDAAGNLQAKAAKRTHRI